MQFYVIPPVANMELALMGDRMYVLAHLYLKYESYRTFVKQRQRAGWFVTLDNSAAERSLVTESALIEVTQDLMPNEVIAPDILFSEYETRKALISFVNRMHTAGLLGEVNIFGCPQGKNKEEWLYSYEFMLKHPNVDVLGLSKIAVPKAFLNMDNDEGIKEGRHLAVAELQERGWLKKPIHCLGMGDPREYDFYKGLPALRSTDSCYTVLAAQNGISFQDDDFRRVPTPHDYFESALNDEQRMLAESNILWMREALH